MTADAVIRFDTKVDNKGFNSGMKGVESALGGVKSALAKIGAAVGVAFGVGALVSFGKAGLKAASEMESAFKGLEPIMEGQGRSFSRAKKFIEEYISDGLIPATDAVTAYKSLAARGYGDDQIKQTMLALKDSAAFGRQSSLSMGEAVKSAAEGLKNENSILVDNAGVTKNVAKMWDEYAQSIGTTASKLTQQQKIQAEVIGILEETKFQTGDAAKVADTYQGAVLRLGFAWNNLKVAFGNALAPIAKAVIPALSALVTWITKAFNAFGQLTAALFGKGKQMSEPAQDTATAFGGAADNAEAAAGGAGDLAKNTKAAGKEAKKSVAAFDELNQLVNADNSNDGGSSSGGGGSGGAGAVMPEIKEITEEIEREFKIELPQGVLDMLENFKRLLENVRQLIGKLEQAWSQFNSGFKNGSFFQTVLENAAKILNHLISEFNKFLSTVNKSDIWKSFETLLPVLAKLIEKVMAFARIIAEFQISNAFTVLTWLFENAASSAQIFAGVIDTITALLNGDLNGALLGIRSILEGIAEHAIFNKLNLLVGLLQNSAVMTSKFAEELTGLEGLSGTVSSGFDVLKDSIKVFKATIFGNKEEKAVALEKLNEDVGKLKESFGTLKQSVVDWWVDFKTQAAEGWENWKKGITDWWNNDVAPWFTLEKWQEIFFNIGVALGTAVAKFIELWTVEIPKWWDTHVAPWFTKEKWLGIFNNIKEAISNKWNEIVTWWTTAIPEWWNNNVAPWFTVEKWKELGGNIKNGLVDGFKSAVGAVVGIINNILETVEKMVNGVISMINSMIDGFNSVPGAPNIKSLNTVTVGRVDVPRLATGTVIPPNKEFLAVLGDQKSGVNIESPLSTIVQAFRDVLSEGSYGGNQPINIIAEGEVGEFIRFLRFKLKDEDARTGSSFSTKAVFAT